MTKIEFFMHINFSRVMFLDFIKNILSLNSVPYYISDWRINFERSHLGTIRKSFEAVNMYFSEGAFGYLESKERISGNFLLETSVIDKNTMYLQVLEGVDFPNLYYMKDAIRAKYFTANANTSPGLFEKRVVPADLLLNFDQNEKLGAGFWVDRHLNIVFLLESGYVSFVGKPDYI